MKTAQASRIYSEKFNKHFKSLIKPNTNDRNRLRYQTESAKGV